MTRSCGLLKVVVILSAIAIGSAQVGLQNTTASSPAPIAFEDTCLLEEGVIENLSCIGSQSPRCFNQAELCNGASFCDNDLDESGDILNDLDCDGRFSQTSFPVWHCETDFVNLTALCNGIDDCIGGTDESNPLCENKCLYPYYGACDYSRECLNTDLTSNCGFCRPGWAQDPTVAGRGSTCLVATFRFTSISYTVEENNGPLIGSIILDTQGELDQAITIIVSTVDSDPSNTAIGSGVDYFTTSATLVFPFRSGGGTTLDFEIPINDDLFIEGQESFQLSATISGGNFSAGGDSATGFINDNDQYEIGYGQAVYETGEGAGSVEVCLETEPGTGTLAANQQFTVFTSQIGQAIESSDFTGISSMTLTLVPGQQEQCYSIDINDDDIDEQRECFQVNVVPDPNPSAGVSITQSTAMVCIIDNDLLDFQLSESSYNVNEGDGFARVCVDLIAGIPQRTIPITLATTPGSATENDFTQTGAITVTFAPNTVPGGAGSQMCTDVPITDDAIVENVEVLTVTATSTDSQVTFPDPNNDFDSASIIIADNDDALFRFNPQAFSFQEDVGLAEIGIQLIENSLSFPITISVVDIFDAAITTASDNVDYTGVFGTVTFGAGSQPFVAMETFTFPIVNDNLVELDEILVLSVASITPNGRGSFVSDTAEVEIVNDDVCEIGFTEPSYTVGESASPAEVCLMKTNNAILTTPVQVSVSTQFLAGTADKDPATAGSDYTSSTATLTLEPGQPLPCFDIEILGDTMDERNELFGVTLTALSNLVAISDPSTEVCITDDDVVLVSLNQNAIQVNENDGSAQVCVDIVSGSANRALTINLATNDITASSGGPGSDYTSGPFSVTFPPNAGSGAQQCAFIPINDDNLVELLENFQVMASPNDAQVMVVAGGMVSFISIVDNDIPLFRFTMDQYQVNEGAGTVTIGVELFDRTLTGALVVSVSDGVAGAGDTATDGVDYTGVTEFIAFMAGDGPGTVREFTIPIIPDNLDEPLEFFTIEGSANAPGSFPSNQAEVEIIDDDVCMVEFTMPVFNIVENEAQVLVCLMKVNSVLLTEPADLLVTTNAGPNDPDKDSAIPGADFTPQTNALLTFSPGGSSVECITIPVNDDTLDEITENFGVTVVSSNTASIAVSGSNSAEVCIEDDDLIEFAFDMPVYTSVEGNPAIMICVNLIEGTLTRDVLVDVNNVIGAGTAVLNEDYGTVSATLSFPSGSAPPTQRCFFFTPIDDITVELTENLQLTLSSPDGEAEFPNGDATVNIEDNDDVTIGFVGVPIFSIPEDGGPQRVCVEIDNPSSQDILEKTVSALLTTADGTALGPADFGLVSMPVFFTPGNQNDEICVDIAIVNDVICEGDEVFSLELTSTDDCVNIAPPASATITIIDDDVIEIGPDQGVVHYNVTEQMDAEVWIPIRLNGQKGPGRECVVEVRTMDGTAKDYMDYVFTEATLTFNSTVTLQNFHVEILDDTICEGHESFYVFLSTASDGCNITQNELVVYIWDDEVHFGDDPHFSIALPGGNLLCYTVQGEHGFSFNLISNDMITMNSKFVPDERRSEVTWLGSMGIIVQDSQYKSSNSTRLRFESSDKSIHIDDKVVLQAKNIERLTFSNGKLTISEAPPATGFRYPSVMVDLQDVEISFTIKFTNQHLDMYWHSTGKKITDSHGLIGQFFRKGVEIDEVRKILIMSNKEPVPVMRRPVWAFMEREEKDDQLCWTAMNAGYQGEGLIDGSYFDYLVDDVMATDFKYSKQ